MSIFEYKLSSDSFDALINDSKLPQVVYLTAVWCQPCKMLRPVLEGVSETFKGQVEFVKVDIDEYPEIAAKFEVRSVPTLVRLVEGIETTRIVGAKPKALLIKELNL